MRQPYAGVDFTPQSGTMNLATECYEELLTINATHFYILIAAVLKVIRKLILSNPILFRPVKIFRFCSTVSFHTVSHGFAGL